MLKTGAQRWGYESSNKALDPYPKTDTLQTMTNAKEISLLTKDMAQAPCKVERVGKETIVQWRGPAWCRIIDVYIRDGRGGLVVIEIGKGNRMRVTEENSIKDLRNYWLECESNVSSLATAEEWLEFVAAVRARAEQVFQEKTDDGSLALELAYEGLARQ